MKRIRVLAAALMLASAVVGAQTAKTVHLNAALSASNQTGGLEASASGSAHVLLRLYLDDSGAAVKAFVDFKLKYWFGQEEMLTAMHIHRGVDGANQYLSLTSAIAAMAGLQEKSYRPDPKAAALYDRLYEEYRQLAGYFGRGGNDVMKRLRELRRQAV